MPEAVTSLSGETSNDSNSSAKKSASVPDWPASNSINSVRLSALATPFHHALTAKLASVFGISVLAASSLAAFAEGVSVPAIVSIALTCWSRGMQLSLHSSQLTLPEIVAWPSAASAAMASGTSRIVLS